ncbi:Crp/Fnr family transcriptional regulator [Tenacibaculum sp. C7A-26P2]|uniref:Crp/Fnr family transcriptional regulator n=1 Tax=Tenacibaculum sp. C7A-26P2 TaxID=3447504 RepID=UPI003F853C3A
MDIQHLTNYLSNYIPLPQKDALLIAEKCKRRVYLKGQYLLQQGDYCKYTNFIISGATKTFHIDEEGKEYIFRFAIENWWAVDLPSFIHQVPSNTNIQALEKTEVIQISSQHLEELYKEIPELEHVFRLLYQEASISLEKRIISSLSHTAKERYILFKKECSKFEKRIPQYMIASYIGISKQYLSEIRKQLTHEL